MVESLDSQESVFCLNVTSDPPPTGLVSVRQEALHREQMLEQKLATLQRLLANTQEASESSWQVGTATTLLKGLKLPHCRETQLMHFTNCSKHALFYCVLLQ